MSCTQAPVDGVSLWKDYRHLPERGWLFFQEGYRLTIVQEYWLLYSTVGQVLISMLAFSNPVASGSKVRRVPSNGYITLLGWIVNAIETAQECNRRHIVVAPQWATDFCAANTIRFIPWDFLRLNERSLEIAEALYAEGLDVAILLFEQTAERSGVNSMVFFE